MLRGEFLEGADDYELLPHQKVEQLKGELDKYKKNPLYDIDSQDRLLSSILRLEKAINSLYALFESVNKEMLSEYEQGEKPDYKLKLLIDQNKRIGASINSIEIMLGNIVKREDASPRPAPTEQQAPNRPQNMQGGRESVEPPIAQNNPVRPSGPPPNPQSQDQRAGFKEQISSGYKNYYSDSTPGFVKPNYPSQDDYPEIQGKQPELTPPIDAKPTRKKKRFAGLF